MIVDYKAQGEWKTQLTMSINFISSKDSDETRNLRTKSNNIEIMMSNKTGEVIDEIFKCFSQNFPKDLEGSMKGSEFNSDGVDLLYYHLQKICLKRDGLYTDFPKWLNNKKAIINPKKNDDNCFQFALTVALNYQNIKNNPERISKIKPFITQYDWKEIDFPSHEKDFKKFELNNKTIAVNILFLLYNTEEIRHAYKSKREA